MAKRMARFPCVRTLEGFEFDAQPSIDPGVIRELATVLISSNRAVTEWGGHVMAARWSPQRSSIACCTTARCSSFVATATGSRRSADQDWSGLWPVPPWPWVGGATSPPQPRGSDGPERDSRSCQPLITTHLPLTIPMGITLGKSPSQSSKP
jgi:hypothetical protein